LWVLIMGQNARRAFISERARREEQEFDVEHLTSDIFRCFFAWAEAFCWAAGTTLGFGYGLNVWV
jgi:hypothetical protein